MRLSIILRFFRFVFRFLLLLFYVVHSLCRVNRCPMMIFISFVSFFNLMALHAVRINFYRTRDDNSAFQEEYYQLLAEKIYKNQKELEEEHQRQREQQQVAQIQQGGVGASLELIVGNTSGSHSPKLPVLGVISHIPSSNIPTNKQRMPPPNITALNNAGPCDQQPQMPQNYNKNLNGCITTMVNTSLDESPIPSTVPGVPLVHFSTTSLQQGHSTQMTDAFKNRQLAQQQQQSPPPLLQPQAQKTQLIGQTSQGQLILTTAQNDNKLHGQWDEHQNIQQMTLEPGRLCKDGMIKQKRLSNSKVGWSEEEDSVLMNALKQNQPISQSDISLPNRTQCAIMHCLYYLNERNPQDLNQDQNNSNKDNEANSESCDSDIENSFASEDEVLKESKCITPKEKRANVENFTIHKDQFEEKKNDHLEAEPFVECSDCGRKQHQICVLHFEQIWSEGYTCDNRLKLKGKKRKENKFTSKRLSQTKLGKYIENRVNTFLKKKDYGAGEVTIRVVSSSDKFVEVKPGMRARYVNTGEWPEQFPYPAKALFAFEEIDGVDTCFFGMHVQEYGSESPMQNRSQLFGEEDPNEQVSPDPKDELPPSAMAGNIVPAIATTNAIVSGLIVLQLLKILTGQISKRQTVYLNKTISYSRNKLIAAGLITPPNKECFVCLPYEQEVHVKINLSTLNVKTLQEKIVVGALNMIKPGVIFLEKGIMLVTGDDEDLEEMGDKVLESFGIKSGTRLKCDDEFQSFKFNLVVIHEL